jgi:iron-sulfur cluster assembly protein
MNPITFSDAAIEHIQSMLAKQPQGIGFRLSIKKTGCSGYAYVPEIIETAKEADIHFVAQHDLNIYVDPQCLEIVNALLIDYVADTNANNGLKQKRLVYINPNERNRCGCGESFTIE